MKEVRKRLSPFCKLSEIDLPANQRLKIKAAISPKIAFPYIATSPIVGKPSPEMTEGAKSVKAIVVNPIGNPIIKDVTIPMF